MSTRIWLVMLDKKGQIYFDAMPVSESEACSTGKILLVNKLMYQSVKHANQLIFQSIKHVLFPYRII